VFRTSLGDSKSQFASTVSQKEFPKDSVLPGNDEPISHEIKELENSDISQFSAGHFSISAASNNSKSKLLDQYDNLLADELTILDLYAKSFHNLVQYLIQTANSAVIDFFNSSDTPGGIKQLDLKNTQFSKNWLKYKIMVDELNIFIDSYNSVREGVDKLNENSVNDLLNKIQSIQTKYREIQSFVKNVFEVKQLSGVLSPTTIAQISRLVSEPVDALGESLTLYDKKKLKAELINNAITSKWEKFNKILRKLDQISHKLKLRKFIVKIEAAKDPEDDKPSFLSKLISATNALATYAAEKFDLNNINEPARNDVADRNDPNQIDLLLAVLKDAQNKAREIKQMFSDLIGSNASVEEESTSQLLEEKVPSATVTGEQSNVTDNRTGMIRNIHDTLQEAETASYAIAQLDDLEKLDKSNPEYSNKLNAKLTTINDGINSAVSIVGKTTDPIIVSSDEQSEINTEIHDLITSVEADIQAEDRPPSPNVGMPNVGMPNVGMSNVGMSNVGMPGGKKTNKTTRKRKANKSKPKRKRTVKRRLTKRRNARKARGKRTMKNRAK
jgi:hypothetical protein